MPKECLWRETQDGWAAFPPPASRFRALSINEATQKLRRPTGDVVTCVLTAASSHGPRLHVTLCISTVVLTTFQPVYVPVSSPINPDTCFLPSKHGRWGLLGQWRHMSPGLRCDAFL